MPPERGQHQGVHDEHPQQPHPGGQEEALGCTKKSYGSREALDPTTMEIALTINDMNASMGISKALASLQPRCAHCNLGVLASHHVSLNPAAV